MASQLNAKSNFTQTFAIHIALKCALKSKRYDGTPVIRKAAEALSKNLGTEKSIYGRQLKMIALMEKGVSIAELGRKLESSRRTVFRYLNHLEDAGVSITLDGGKYRIEKSVARMLRA